MNTINTERILLWVILTVVLLNFLPQRYVRERNEHPKITIEKDTVWQTKTDTFKVQTIKYEKVYVHKKDVQKFAKDTTKIDTTQYQLAKVYNDTLSNNDIDIYSYNLLDGNLLDSRLSYKLKIPREITVTKTIEHPKTYRSGLYLFSEIGGTTQQFDNISLGLQYNRKGNWFASYRLNLINAKQSTHNIGVGVRLFD